MPANQVRKLRKQLLMSQRELAKKSGVSLRTINSVEKGNNCQQNTKRKILLALDLKFVDKSAVFDIQVGGVRECESVRSMIEDSVTNAGDFVFVGDEFFQILNHLLICRDCPEFVKRLFPKRFL